MENGHQRRQEVQTPPHGDQLETAMAAELDAFLQKQSALAASRMQDLTRTMNELKRLQEIAQQRASIALRAYAHTTVVIRQETERVGEVVQELGEGLEKVDDAVTLAARQN
jgi:hypothetical protein